MNQPKVGLTFDHTICSYLFGLAYQGKGFVFRFIIEYSNLRDFGPKVIIINSGGFTSNI
jgi:hypothetical protein